MKPSAFVSTFPLGRQKSAQVLRHSSHNSIPFVMEASAQSRVAPRISLARIALSVALALSFKGVTSVRAHERLMESPSPQMTVVATSSAFKSPVPAVLVAKPPRPTPNEVKKPQEPKSFEEKELELLSGKQSAPKLSEKIAARLRRADVPDALIVLILSALPVVELRAGIPVGFLLGLPAWQTFLLAICGNLLPILPLLYILRLPPVQRTASWIISRAQKKAEKFGTANSRASTLALFVGIPLPGTGAWTGTVIAFVLGMAPGAAFTSLAGGVVMSAIIVTSLCQLGWIGAGIAGAVLMAVGITGIVQALQHE